MERVSRKKQLLGTLGLLSATIMWGFSFVVVKDSTDSIPIWYMLALRYLIAVVGMLPYVYHKRNLITKKMLKQGVVIGILLVVGHFFQTIGCKYTTAGKNAFITTFYVILVPLFGWWFKKRRPDNKTFVAAVVALVGLALISLQDNLSVQSGDILTFICSMALAIHIVAVDDYTAESDPLLLTFWQFFFGDVISWIVVLIFRMPFPMEVLQPEGIMAMLYIGLFSTLIGIAIQIVCQKFTNPNVAAVILSMESLFGMIFSVIFLGETPTTRMIIGCACMLGAVMMSEIKLQK